MVEEGWIGKLEKHRQAVRELLATPPPPPTARDIACENAPAHLIVLAHGLDGTENDLDYVRRTMLERSKRWGSDSPMVLASSANTGRTKDGVAEGGFRLAMEVAEVIRKRPELTQISFVGHSLGGLYARYAVAALYSDGRIGGLRPGAYVSSCSPHLGLRRFTLTFTPSGLHPLSGLMLGQTGLDLFLRGSAPLLSDMAVHKEFLCGMACFDRRRAYANISGDLLVPFATASFTVDVPGHALSPPLPPPPRGRVCTFPSIDDGFKGTWSYYRYFFGKGKPQNSEVAAAFLATASPLPDCDPHALCEYVVLASTPATSSTVEEAAQEEEAMAYGLDSVGWSKVGVSLKRTWSPHTWLPLAHSRVCANERKGIHTMIAPLWRDGRAVMDHLVDYVLVESASV